MRGALRLSRGDDPDARLVLVLVEHRRGVAFRARARRHDVARLDALPGVEQRAAFVGRPVPVAVLAPAPSRQDVDRALPSGDDNLRGWTDRLLARRPTNVVLVAMANKTARVAWALLRYERIYRPTPA